MNFKLIAHILGMIALIVSGFMTASLPWSFPLFGQVQSIDWRGFGGMAASIAVSLLTGLILLHFGRGSQRDRLLRREALATVALAWLLATALGALPYLFTGTARARAETGPVYMTIFDAVFESASGYSGTGASVLSDVEDPLLVPRSVLFWRSETHFLGGLGIVVLFVAVLGMGSAGKQLIRAEVAAPSQTTSTHEQTRRAAMAFGGVFVSLNVILTVLLLLQGMSLFDALCHAFGTVATGGFSTYNSSIGHFKSWTIEATINIFMFLGCTNFALLYFVSKGNLSRLINDVEFRVYITIMLVAILVMLACLLLQDQQLRRQPLLALRYCVFQCISIQTNTGFATTDFDQWPPFARGILLVLMYIGGCAGSTSCSVKVIRYIFLFKILALELEQVYRPNVVRVLRIGQQPITDADLLKSVLIYFAMIVLLTVLAWLALLAVEPLSTWQGVGSSKMLDCFSAVAATLNGVGPGFGLVGPTSNFGALHAPAKCILTVLMLLGRLELFPLLVILTPRFWRTK